jgi:hypothetical protein
MPRSDRRNVTRTGIQAASASDALAQLKQAWRDKHSDEPPSALAGLDGPY